MRSDDIREAFVAFWKARDGRLVPSSSLIPHNDPTVLLTTAGMQQFVPYFLGQQAPPDPPRLISVQKCFRTSDIDEVGDRSHLTFFEMLGNFSIGDYFKEQVIPWALEFSTTHLGLDQHRIWITVHETDDEAERIWIKSGIPLERIKRFGDEHNWWGPPGKTGPCGPNTELYYEQDANQGFNPGCGFPEDPPDCDCGRLEYWNLVLMQFFQDENKERRPLPQPNVDTGMGLERATVVVNGLRSIYDTDLFQPIIAAVQERSGVRYGATPDADYALRVLADHGRAMTFLVADGVVPGTGGRNYVLRRVIRRAIRYGRRLGVEGAFLDHIVDAVIDRMLSHYPELSTDRARIRQVIATEEELFDRTLRAGSAQIERLIAEAQRRDQLTVPGERVFDLYQTYGFPSELTEELLRERGLGFSREEYERALEQEQQRARARTGFRQAEHTGDSEFGGLPETEFLAWTDTSSQARVLALRENRLVLEASPFYPEGGGQVGDTGWIRTPSGLFVVEDTQLDATGHVVHYGRVQDGAVELGELARAEVDAARRDRTRRHHTATHLLHRALKDVLGPGTSQQGSEVAPDALRFDFNAAQPMTRDDLERVTSILNERSMDDLPVEWEIMPIERARHLGATMMFGEKYGNQVRVVSIGDYSRELCGGTHTHHSGELGLVVIGSETGIGSGKRRIVAYAGRAAMAHLRERLRMLDSIGEQVGAPSLEQTPARLDALLAELETTRRRLEQLEQQQANESASRIASRATEVQGVKVVAAAIDHADQATLERLVDAVRDELRSGVVVLGTTDNGRVRLIAGLSRDLTSRLKAGPLLNEIAQIVGGKAGGPPHFAHGGGTDPSRLDEALRHTRVVVARTLGGS